MSVVLPARLQRFVEEQVASGQYRSADEVLVEAVRLMDERERQLAALRADIRKGLESGPAFEISIDEIIEQARRELEAEAGQR